MSEEYTRAYGRFAPSSASCTFNHSLSAFIAVSSLEAYTTLDNWAYDRKMENIKGNWVVRSLSDGLRFALPVGAGFYVTKELERKREKFDLLNPFLGGYVTASCFLLSDSLSMQPRMIAKKAPMHQFISPLIFASAFAAGYYILG